MDTKVVGQRLDRAIQKVKGLGIDFKADDLRPYLNVITNISDIDKEKILYIARTLSAMQAFDKLVSENLKKVNYSDRFNDITDSFDGIIDDLKKQIEQEEKGGPSFKDRIRNLAVKLYYGDVSKRFASIEETYNSVIHDTGETIAAQTKILDAYSVARLSLKDAEIASIEIHEIMVSIRDEARANVVLANDAIEKIKQNQGDKVDISKAELLRDEAVIYAKKQDKRFQITKDLTEMLVVSYAVTETVFEKYKQSHLVLDRLYQKSMMFFQINRPVISSLKATYTGLLVVDEMAKAQEAMQDGLNKSMEALASIGNTALKESLAVAHGPTLKASSVKILMDSIVNYQTESKEIIEENRRLSTQEANGIKDHVEEGKKRLSELTEKIQ